jgi:hypothetical protein
MEKPTLCLLVLFCTKQTTVPVYTRNQSNWTILVKSIQRYGNETQASIDGFNNLERAQDKYE